MSKLLLNTKLSFTFLFVYFYLDFLKIRISSAKFKLATCRRRVLNYSEDSNLLMRLFWQTANSVLWLFSFVWQFRGDDVYSVFIFYFFEYFPIVLQVI